MCSRDVGLINLWIGRGGKSVVDNNAIFILRDGLVLGVEGEREVSGVLDWRGEEST